MFLIEKYPGHEPDEKIIFSFRRHWFILFRNIVTFLFFALIPLAIAYLFRKFNQENPFNGPISYPMVILGLSIYYLGLITHLYNHFVDYYLDNWIVTNHRIINIESENLFNRTVSEQLLHRVQDVTAESKGFFPTILNYGDIYIQTAAEKERFMFEQVSDPFDHARQIQALVNSCKQKHPGHE